MTALVYVVAGGALWIGVAVLALALCVTSRRGDEQVVHVHGLSVDGKTLARAVADEISRQGATQ